MANWIGENQKQSVREEQVRFTRAKIAHLHGLRRVRDLTVHEKINLSNLEYWYEEMLK